MHNQFRAGNTPLEFEKVGDSLVFEGGFPGFFRGGNPWIFKSGNSLDFKMGILFIFLKWGFP